jgi:hypothetical protein
MAAYPNLGQTTQSSESWEDDVQIERASNGAARGRALFAGRKLTLQIAHICERSDVATLLSFYDSNRLLPVDVTWAGDGVTRAMLFAGPPDVQTEGGTLWRVSCRMVEA